MTETGANHIWDHSFSKRLELSKEKKHTWDFCLWPSTAGKSSIQRLSRVKRLTLESLGIWPTKETAGTLKCCWWKYELSSMPLGCFKLYLNCCSGRKGKIRGQENPSGFLAGNRPLSHLRWPPPALSKVGAFFSSPHTAGAVVRALGTSQRELWKVLASNVIMEQAFLWTVALQQGHSLAPKTRRPLRVKQL